MPENFENITESGEGVLRKFEWERGEATVRHPSENDLEGIVDAETSMRKVSTAAGRKDFKPLGGEDILAIKKELSDAKEGKEILLVVEAEGKARGFIIIKRNQDFKKEPSPDDYEKVTVMGITVHSDYRRKGFGVQLLECGISEAKSLFHPKMVELNTDEDNVARGMYEKCGFNTISIGPETKKRKDKTLKRVHMEKRLLY